MKKLLLWSILFLCVVCASSGPACAESPKGKGQRQDKRPHVVLVSYEDEYHSAETLPRFAKELCDRYGCRCSFLLGEKKTGILGLEKLATADVLVLYVRRKALPKEQMDLLQRYLKAGNPLVALRTASHAFDINAKPPEGLKTWPTFDHEVLGGNYHGHGGIGLRTEIIAADKAAGHPILAGVHVLHWTSPATLYNVSPVASNATVLLLGKHNTGSEPIAWTRTYHGGRVFYTSLGHVDDFQTPQFRRLLVNAIYWAMDKPMPEKP